MFEVRGLSMENMRGRTSEEGAPEKEDNKPLHEIPTPLLTMDTQIRPSRHTP